MYNKRIKVIGGVREKENENSKDASFKVKKVVVIESKDLAALFRRDPELCGMSIRFQDTTEALTPNMTFSDLPLPA